MGYTPENNPYIPGDPYSYDLKWIIQQIKAWKDPEASAAQAKASAEAAAASATEAASYAAMVQNIVITPEMYGAVGDGVTDDTAAVQAAIDDELPIYVSQNYLVSGITCAHDLFMFGPGSFKASTPVIKLFDITGNNIYIDGITVDGQALVAQLITANGSGNATIINCIAHNTNNDQIVPVSACDGILISGYAKITVENCKVYDINRTNTNPGIISSVGIVAQTDGQAIIVNNYIENVACSQETTDCDGIYVTAASSPITDPPTVATIENNIIIDPTGRFVKTQCKVATIKNNKCELINCTSGLFFKAFDFQWGGGEASDNDISFGNKIGSSSMFVHADYNINQNRTLRIVGNKLSDFGGNLRSLFHADGSTVNGIVEVSNNIAIGTVVYYALNLQSTNAPELQFICKKNEAPWYRFINTSLSDLTKVYLNITDNICTYSSRPPIFTGAVSCNNIVLKNNVNFGVLTNTTVTLQATGNCEFTHSAANSYITNYPGTLGARAWIKQVDYDRVIYADLTNAATGVFSI